MQDHTKTGAQTHTYIYTHTKNYLVVKCEENSGSPFLYLSNHCLTGTTTDPSTTLVGDGHMDEQGTVGHGVACIGQQLYMSVT